MSASPLVSVIIPFLNEEAFLAEAIESVLKQSYLNWEIILIDDGSSDNSSFIAKKYAVEYPDRIFYYDHEGHSNKGLSHSRNTAIQFAKGEFIALLDADDVWLSEKLQIQMQQLCEQPEAVMLCEASEYWFSPWDGENEKNEVVQIGNSQNLLLRPFEMLSQVYPLSEGAAPCPSGIIIKRETVLKYNGFESHFSGKYQLYEDQAFLHKIYLSENVFISSACNNRYRQRDNSLVKSIIREGNYLVVRKYFLEWLRLYVKQNKIENEQVEYLLKRALAPYRFSFKREANKYLDKARILYHGLRSKIARLRNKNKIDLKRVNADR